MQVQNLFFISSLGPAGIIVISECSASLKCEKMHWLDLCVLQHDENEHPMRCARKATTMLTWIWELRKIVSKML